MVTRPGGEGSSAAGTAGRPHPSPPPTSERWTRARARPGRPARCQSQDRRSVTRPGGVTWNGLLAPGERLWSSILLRASTRILGRGRYASRRIAWGRGSARALRAIQKRYPLVVNRLGTNGKAQGMGDRVWEALAALVPSAGVAGLFWLAMRSIVRADRNERAALAKLDEAETTRSRPGSSGLVRKDATTELGPVDPQSPSAQGVTSMSGE